MSGRGRRSSTVTQRRRSSVAVNRRSSLSSSASSGGIAILRDTVTSLSQKTASSTAPRGFRHINDLQQQVKRLQREVKNNTELGTEQQTSIEDLKSKNKALREAVKTMHEVFVEDFESQQEESNTRYSSLAKQLEDQRMQITSLKEQLVAAKADTTGYREALETRWSTVDALIEDVRTIHKDLIQLEHMKTDLSEVDSRARQQLQKMEAVTASHANMGEWVQQIRAEVAALQAAMLTFKEV